MMTGSPQTEGEPTWGVRSGSSVVLHSVIWANGMFFLMTIESVNRVSQGADGWWRGFQADLSGSAICLHAGLEVVGALRHRLSGLRSAWRHRSLGAVGRACQWVMPSV
jgi:hypothetical protein